MYYVFAGDLCISIKHSRYLFADDMGIVCVIILAFNSLALILLRSWCYQFFFLLALQPIVGLYLQPSSGL